MDASLLNQMAVMRGVPGFKPLLFRRCCYNCVNSRIGHEMYSCLRHGLEFGFDDEAHTSTLLHTYRCDDHETAPALHSKGRR